VILSETEIIRPDGRGGEERVAQTAGRYLKEGKVLAIPTDTVYGLAAAVDNEEAKEKIYKIKGRSFSKPLAILVADPDSVWSRRVRYQAAADALMKAFWPGGLTIILEEGESQKTIAFRQPALKITLEIIKAAGGAVCATSANRSGLEALSTAQRVLKIFNGQIDAVIDAGPAPLGQESTVVKIEQGRAKILRLGAVSREALEDILEVDI